MAILNDSRVDLQENSITCHHSTATATATAATAASEGSSRSSDADGRSWHSPFDSTAGGSDGHRASSLSTSEIVGVSDKMRDSSVSQCSVELVDLEAGVPETKLHLAKYERDCRICHMTLDASNQESGVPIELGCSCKDDLAAAHKHCAEAWFKIKGNKKMWEWQGDDFSLQEDVPKILWNNVSHNENLSYIFDDITPIKACGDVGYHATNSENTKNVKTCKLSSYQVQRGRMLQFDT